MQKKLIITIHGIRTFGQWQERLGTLIGQTSPQKVALEHYHYGYFSVIAFLFPPFRWLATRHFRAKLLSIIRDYPDHQVSVVSHSFGTHLIGWGLRGIQKHQRPKIKNVILAGSVLRNSFPWDELLDDGTIQRIINDCGIDDNILILSQFFVLMTGMAGRLGFTGMTGSRLINRYFSGGHSHYFLKGGKPYDDFMARYWVPVLALDEKPQLVDERVVKGPVQGIVITLLQIADPIKFIVYFGVLFALLVYGYYLPRLEAEKQRERAEMESIQRQLTAAIAALSDNSLRLSEEGRTGLATQLALQAYRFDPENKLGMQSRVYAALRRSLGSGAFNQIVSETDGAPNSVATSKDGRMLVIGRSDGSIEVFDLTRGAAPIATTRFHGVAIKALTFLPGRRFAVGRDDGEVWLVSIEGSSLKSSFLGDCGTVEALASNPSGRIIAAGTEVDGACLLDPERPDVTAYREVKGVVRALAFSADGKWLAAGHKGGVALWASDEESVSTSSIALSLDGETVTAVQFGPAHLAVGAHTDFGTRLADAFQRRDFSGPDSRAQGTLKVWHLANLGSPPLVVAAQAQRVLALAFSRNGETLASGGVDGKIHLWAVGDFHRPPRELDGHTGNIVSLAFVGTKGILVSAGADRSVRVWGLAGPPDAAITTAGAVLSLDFLDRDHLVAAEKLGQTPLVWDLRNSPPVRVNTPEVPGVTTSVAADSSKPGRFAFGTGLLVGSTPDATVRVWDIAEGRFAAEPVVTHRSDVDALAFSATGRWLASAGYLDKILKVLDRRSGQVREFRLPDDLGAIAAVAFHPRADPPIIALGGDGRLAIVETASGSLTQVQHAFERSPAHVWRVADLEFSADGALLATTAPDGKTRLWHFGEWTRPHAIFEPPWAAGPVGVRQLAFNPVSGDLAIGYQDGAIRTWGPHAPQRPSILIHSASGGAVQSLAFDPSGTTLAAGFANGGIEIMSTLSSLVTMGCAGLFRNLSEAEWATFVGTRLDYVKACPGSPAPTQQER
jgi:WD40 repeat protein